MEKSNEKNRKLHVKTKMQNQECRRKTRTGRQKNKVKKQKWTTCKISGFLFNIENEGQVICTVKLQ